jgi:hypothetical protein
LITTKAISATVIWMRSAFSLVPWKYRSAQAEAAKWNLDKTTVVPAAILNYVVPF